MSIQFMLQQNITLFTQFSEGEGYKIHAYLTPRKPGRMKITASGSTYQEALDNLLSITQEDLDKLLAEKNKE